VTAPRGRDHPEALPGRRPRSARVTRAGPLAAGGARTAIGRRRPAFASGARRNWPSVSSTWTVAKAKRTPQAATAPAAASRRAGGRRRVRGLRKALRDELEMLAPASTAGFGRWLSQRRVGDSGHDVPRFDDGCRGVRRSTARKRALSALGWRPLSRFGGVRPSENEAVLGLGAADAGQSRRADAAAGDGGGEALLDQAVLAGVIGQHGATAAPG